MAPSSYRSLRYTPSCSIYQHRNESGLPFYDVIIADNLPKAASLPVATVQQAKARLTDGRWDFDYVFFTESDQVTVQIRTCMHDVL
jgi:hypothetical protein